MIRSSVGKMVNDRQILPEEVERLVVAEKRNGVKNKRTRDGSLILPGGGWRPHDLRRTGATLMQMLGVRNEVVQRCLSHIDPDKVKTTYLRWDYEPQSREAWIKLGSMISELTLPDDADLHRIDGVEHQGD